MPLFPFGLAGAKDAVEELVTRLDLEAFQFIVEQIERFGSCASRCATEEGWQTRTMLLGDKLPAAGATGEEASLAKGACNELKLTCGRTDRT